MSKQTVAIGDNGTELVSKLSNNFNELYIGSGGVGYVIQNEDDIDSEEWWEIKASTYNTFTILTDFNFQGKTLSLPLNIVLVFNGGVWSNGVLIGNNNSFEVYGLRQAFNTDLTLTGIWNNKEIYPQYYGAKTNSNTSVFENDCSVAINMCINSLFTVKLSTGFYYITESINFTIPKTVICDQTVPGYEDDVCYNANHTRIYTDKDIDLIRILSNEVKWIGGVIDVIQVPSFTKSCVYYSFDYSNVSSNIDIVLYGSRSKLKAGNNTGYGVHFDLYNASVDWGIVYGASLHLGIYYFKTGIYQSSLPEESELNNGMNSMSVSGWFWGNKKSMFFETGSMCRFDALLQADYVCTYEEHLNSGNCEFYCSDSIIDIMGWDFNESPSGGYYTGQYRVVNYGVNNIFKDKTIVNYQYGGQSISLTQLQSANIIENSRFVWVSQTAYGRNSALPFISYINNQLAFILRTVPSTTLNLYDGEGYDFDANLDVSTGLPAATSMKVVVGSSLNYLNEYRTGRAVDLYSTLESKASTDFLEIVIPWESPLYGSFINGEIFLYERGNQFLRIQVIYKRSGSTSVHNIIPSELSTGNQYKRYSLPDNTQYSLNDKMILRFIGLNYYSGTTNEIVTILSVANRADVTIHSPIIDLGGGQTIYGNLAVNDGVKEVDLPVYADNAAAKVGGLVAGDPYRTSTGIRMVVYD